MSTFHLHPVSHPHSPSPPSSTSTATAHSPLPKQYVLRDVNITQDVSAGPRKYPAPPTGHELMALFPPAPPTAETRLSTSGFFQRQERAFFAQAGREILRTWPQHSPVEVASSPSSPPYPRSKPHRTMSGPPPPASPHTAAHTPTAPPNNLNAPMVPQPAPLSSPQAHHPHDHHHLPHHPPHPSALGPRPPHDHHHHHPHPPQQPPPMPAGLSKVEFQAPEDYRDDNPHANVGPGGPDDSWRRPTPYADRRRAGKHTRRIIVRT